MTHSKEKDKSIETVLDLRVDIVDKDFKATVLKMLTVLKEYVKKVKKHE